MQEEENRADMKELMGVLRYTSLSESRKETQIYMEAY